MKKMSNLVLVLFWHKTIRLHFVSAAYRVEVVSEERVFKTLVIIKTRSLLSVVKKTSTCDVFKHFQKLLTFT